MARVRAPGTNRAGRGQLSITPHCYGGGRSCKPQERVRHRPNPVGSRSGEPPADTPARRACPAPGRRPDPDRFRPEKSSTMVADLGRRDKTAVHFTEGPGRPARSRRQRQPARADLGPGRHRNQAVRRKEACPLGRLWRRGENAHGGVMEDTYESENVFSPFTRPSRGAFPTTTRTRDGLACPAKPPRPDRRASRLSAVRRQRSPREWRGWRTGKSNPAKRPQLRRSTRF